jgi:hypothetical protein
LSKIILAKRNSAIFLSILLVLGTIATVLPSAQAQPYDLNIGYGSYEPEPEYTNSNSYEPREYPTYSQDYQQEYQSDNSYAKSKDSSNTIIKKIKCNNINANLNGVEANLGIPNDDGAIAEAQEEDQTTAANGWGYSEGYRQNSNDFKFVCVNNNDNTVVVINETTPEPTITCEECFEEVFSPEILEILDEVLANGGITITLEDGETITPRSLTALCEALQDASGFEIFNALQTFAGSNIPNLVFCLGAAFGVDTTGVQ